MKIWKIPFDIQKAAERSKNTMVSHLGIEFTKVGDDYVCAQMPVDNRTCQPMGIMHGGASCALAETVGSIAANFCVDPREFSCVGLDINTNHIRSVSSGYVFATAKPFHLGSSTQVWEITIVNEQEQLISISRLTIAVLKNKMDKRIKQ